MSPPIPMVVVYIGPARTTCEGNNIFQKFDPQLVQDQKTIHACIRSREFEVLNITSVDQNVLDKFLQEFAFSPDQYENICQHIFERYFQLKYTMGWVYSHISLERGRHIKQLMADLHRSWLKVSNHARLRIAGE